jgi:hypothetical protein
MIVQEANKFLRFGDRNSIGRSLYNIYEQYCLSICALVHGELTNPSYNGFNVYCAYAMVNSNSNGFFMPLVTEARDLMLKAATFLKYDPIDGLTDLPSFKQGKKMVHHDGWFSYFFQCVEEVSNKSMSLTIMLDQHKTLDDMVSFFRTFDYRENQKLIKQPFVLIFAILNLFNHKHTPLNADNDSRKPGTFFVLGQ